VVGLVAIKSFMNILRQAKGANNRTTVVEVVRAKADIPAAVEITNEMVEIAEVPAELAPDAAIKKLDSAIGRVTNLMIPAGQGVVVTMLAPPGTPAGMGARIEKGYRAVAIKVDEIVGVAGWIIPGSIVDVYLTLTSASGSRRATYSRAILQNVKVLAVGQQSQGDGIDASVRRSVTVQVTPKEAAILHLAATKGKLQLAMRSPTDDEEEKLMAVTDKELIGGDSSQDARDRAAAAATMLSSMMSKQAQSTQVQADKTDAVAMAPETEEWVVEVLQGSKTSQLRFESDEKDAKAVSNTTGSGLQKGQPSSSTAKPSGSTGLPIGAGASGQSDSDADQEKDRQSLLELIGE
jgi:pilus assembly protein CpaB